MKVLLLTDPMPPGVFVQATSAMEDLVLLPYHRDLSDADLADVEVVLAWHVPEGVYARLPRLRWVCSVAAGVEKLLTADLPAHIPVSRIVDVDQAEGIAQFVVMMALRHARSLPRYEVQQQQKQWVRHPVSAVRSRVSVLGMGTMGAAIARLLSAVGFAVTGWSRRSELDLDEILAASDIVVCALPLTPQTQGILNAQTLALLPRGAYLINVARGGHVVEADLICAVRSQHLSGAALDVQRREPMPADDALWDVPGITITPHIGAQSSVQTIAAQFGEGLEALRTGSPLPRLVDRAVGY
jgi:glyoxylate/hydroxypyruvate reductase